METAIAVVLVILLISSRSQITALKQDIQNLEQRVVSSQAELSDLVKGEIAKLDVYAAVAEFREEIGRLRDVTNKTLQDLDPLVKRLESVNYTLPPHLETLKSQTAKLGDITSQLSAKTNMLNQISLAIDDLHVVLKDFQTEKIQKKKLEAVIESLRQEKNDLDTEIARLTSQVEVLYEELEELQVPTSLEIPARTSRPTETYVSLEGTQVPFVETETTYTLTVKSMDPKLNILGNGMITLAIPQDNTVYDNVILQYWDKNANRWKIPQEPKEKVSGLEKTFDMLTGGAAVITGRFIPVGGLAIGAFQVAVKFVQFIGEKLKSIGQKPIMKEFTDPDQNIYDYPIIHWQDMPETEIIKIMIKLEFKEPSQHERICFFTAYNLSRPLNLWDRFLLTIRLKSLPIVTSEGEVVVAPKPHRIISTKEEEVTRPRDEEEKEREEAPEVKFPTYKIILLQSEVDPDFKNGWGMAGGPEQYIVVKHNEREIIRTETRRGSYRVVWKGITGQCAFRTRDAIKVWLMDKDWRVDDKIAEWEVDNPMDLEYLSFGKNSVRFKVTEVD